MTIGIFDLFKIGIGPSSSHTVGPMVAARRFIIDVSENKNIQSVTKLRVELFGSLGATGKGHGTLKAIILGLMGDTPDKVDVATINSRVDEIKASGVLHLLSEHPITFDVNEDLVFHRNISLPAHANGMSFTAFSKDGEKLFEKNYYSIGGGFIVDEAELSSDDVIVKDHRQLLYPFSSGEELLKSCQRHNLSIAEIMLQNEQAWRDEKDTLQGMDELWEVMKSCVKRGCLEEGILPGGLKVKRRAKKLHEKLLEDKQENSLLVLDWVTLYALAVNEENASGGRVVTAPTNGAAGIIPAVLHYYFNFVDGANRQGVHDFLLTATAIGVLFKENASISGAEVGCQGEVGSACSMAAAGLTAVSGGTPEQIENAAEIAMEHHLGLTCDPIGGLVQIPCIERNAVGAVKAIHASRIALSGDGSHFVSLDKVIQTMRETGKDMLDKYKETSRGGLAVNVIEIPVNIIEC